jgi:hypothetical protein
MMLLANLVQKFPRMVEIFCTNVTEHQHAAALLIFLRSQLPSYRITFDLDDRDRILRVQHKYVCAKTVMALMRQQGVAIEVCE